MKFAMTRANGKNNLGEPLRTPADRWVRHAEALRVRGLRNSLLGGFPQMEFLRRAAARCQMNHYWQLAVSRFSPQIHLAIRPLLREAGWPEASAIAIRERQAAASSLPQPPRYMPGGPAQPLAVARPVSPAVTYRAIPRSDWRGPANEFTTLAARLRQHVTLRTETSESALELTLHRVTQKARRVEERLPGTLAMIVRKPVPATMVAGGLAARGPEPPVPPHRVFETTGEAPWARATAPPPLNIEYLTGQVIRQIDSRMIAMRERMGRV